GGTRRGTPPLAGSAACGKYAVNASSITLPPCAADAPLSRDAPLRQCQQQHPQRSLPRAPRAKTTPPPPPFTRTSQGTRNEPVAPSESALAAKPMVTFANN
ncbi:uncharacterized protein Tco025E_07534, partial [Trypanosoma conorhini]